MIEVGKSVGIDFSYGGKIGNTLNSHRLVEWASARGADKEDAMIEALMSAYVSLAVHSCG